MSCLCFEIWATTGVVGNALSAQPQLQSSWIVPHALVCTPLCFCSFLFLPGLFLHITTTCHITSSSLFFLTPRPSLLFSRFFLPHTGMNQVVWWVIPWCEVQALSLSLLAVRDTEKFFFLCASVSLLQGRVMKFRLSLLLLFSLYVCQLDMGFRYPFLPNLHPCGIGCPVCQLETLGGRLYWEAYGFPNCCCWPSMPGCWANPQLQQCCESVVPILPPGSHSYNRFGVQGDERRKMCAEKHRVEMWVK